jgi:AcrR family transcriptional regulator
MSIQSRRDRERADRERLIVTAARELAEAEGWDAVTTRRLAARIEYSQPVLYSHFGGGKAAIMAAAALEGFAELAADLRAARAAAGTPRAALAAAAGAYTAFAAAKPALYDAMFTLHADLPFGADDTPQVMRDAFGELIDSVRPAAGDRDLETLTEAFWSGLHGTVTLTRSHRLRPDHAAARLDLLVDLYLP